MQQTQIIYRICARVLAKPQQQIDRSSRNPSKAPYAKGPRFQPPARRKRGSSRRRYDQWANP